MITLVLFYYELIEPRSSRLLPESEESVVEEWSDETSLASEDHDHSEGEQEDLMEGHETKNVPRLKFNQTDE